MNRLAVGVFWVTLVCKTIVVAPALAQTDLPPIPTPDTSTAVVDTTVDTRFFDTLATPPAAPINTGAARKSREWPGPTSVLLRSVVVPGWGQFTNRKYFKAALAFGLEAWFLTGAVSNWRKANDARDRVLNDPANRIQHFSDYEFYWGNRGDYLWLLGLTVFVSMFDAYVDAHLIPYDKDTIPGVEPPKGLQVVLLHF